MGYKMPIVCQEVYLPFERGDTLANYKEKYGIDINDYISVENGSIYAKDLKKPTKIFVVADARAQTYGITVTPLKFMIVGGETETFQVIDINVTRDESGNIYSGLYVTYDEQNQQFLINEI